ncbi:MAG TPA: SDR family oxidoreductase [Solirubrobacteraceae bacterium]|jgi:NAD(P)H dehydrogenase (quinone)
MTLGITGASGQLGRLTTSFVLETASPADVVLITRQPDALSEATALGAEVRAGDFDDPEALVSALAGVDRLLMISTDIIGTRIPQHQAAVRAAEQAGVGHVIYTSALRPSADNPAAVAEEHRATEEALTASGLDWTFLRNGLYTELLLRTAPQAVASGKLVGNAGPGVTARVAREDCAAVAAAVLTTSGHAGMTYDVTGPELMADADVAELLSELTGQPVEAVEISDEDLLARLESNGLPTAAAAAVVSFGTAIRLGYFSGLTSVVEDLTGRQPRSYRDVLEANLGQIAGTAQRG